MKKAILGICLVGTFFVQAQTSIYFGGNTGLLNNNKDFGASYRGYAGVVLKNFIIEANYLQSKPSDRQNIGFDLHKYALVAGYEDSFSDGLFTMQAKAGPSFSQFKRLESGNVNQLGFDLGLQMSYQLFHGLYINSGFQITHNKTTKNMKVFEIGLHYRIPISKE